MSMPLITLGENRINLFNVTHVVTYPKPFPGRTEERPPETCEIWFTNGQKLLLTNPGQVFVFVRYWDEAGERLVVDLPANEDTTVGPQERAPLDLGRGGSHAP